MIGIILAAGASTRMKTRVSKLLHDVLGKPVIAWSLEQAAKVCDEIIVVVGHQKEEVEATARKFVPQTVKKIHFVEQKAPKGTADAVRVTLPIIQSKSHELVFIMGADSFLLKAESLKKWVEESVEKRALLSLLTCRCLRPNAYGRIARNNQGAIQKIVEFKDASEQEKNITEVNSGFYLCQVSVLQEALLQMKNQNRAQEFYLTDIVAFCRDKSRLIHSQEVAEEEAAGANNLEELAELERVLQKRIVNDWMSKGVRFLSPDTVRVESSVVLNPDSVISAGVHLLGKTEIGAGVTVGPFSVIEDSRIDENSRIESHCVLTGAKLGKNVSIGPFARLRPGSDLADDVHIGNFVEIKKSTLGTGVKAGHLTYLGDAEVGAHTNVGAGTITCNYDGFAKHKTIIEERVFIGSNTSLVAPVVVGTGAIVGAGSVIVENIEKDSLSFERSQQIHKPGGAQKFRSRYESGRNIKEPE